MNDSEVYLLMLHAGWKSPLPAPQITLFIFCHYVLIQGLGFHFFGLLTLSEGNLGGFFLAIVKSSIITILTLIENDEVHFFLSSTPLSDEEPLKTVKLLNGMCKHTLLFQYSEREGFKGLCLYCFWIPSFHGDSPYFSVFCSSLGSFVFIFLFCSRYAYTFLKVLLGIFH